MVFYKYCTNIEQILCIYYADNALLEYCPNNVQIFYKYLFNLVSFQFEDDHVLFKYWQIFCKYCTNIVQIFSTYGVNIDSILKHGNKVCYMAIQG